MLSSPRRSITVRTLTRERWRDLEAVFQAKGCSVARKRGATLLEAYPVDKTGRVPNEWLWLGTKSMYDQAGFHEVARRRPGRPVVRRRLR